MSSLSSNIDIIINTLTSDFGTNYHIEHWLPEVNNSDTFSRLSKKALSIHKPSIFISPMTADCKQASTVLGGDNTRAVPVPVVINSLSMILFVKKTAYDTNGLDLYKLEENVMNSLVNLKLSSSNSFLLLDSTVRSNTAYNNNIVMNSIINYKFSYLINGELIS